MFGTPAEIINSLSNELCVEHNLIIEEIKNSSELVALFRETVEDFTEYPTLREALAGQL